jgi:photosystem II stability/assembly factor-like uncharacterized protein
MRVEKPDHTTLFDQTTDAEALEALIKEARRRARRRRLWYGAMGLVAASAVLLAFAGFTAGGGNTPRPHEQERRGEPNVAAQVKAGKWTAVPILEGHASVAAIDPQHPEILYATSIDAGIFKSSNSGRSWRPLDLPPGSGRVDALALDPSDPDTVYAGTSVGVFKSGDGGDSWRLAFSGLDPGSDTNWRRMLEGWIYTLAVNPHDPRTVYAGTFGELYKSTNGGSNWHVISLPTDKRFAGSIALDPTTPATIYATALAPNWKQSQLLKSADGGATWQVVGPEGKRVVTVALDPHNAETVYAGTDDPGGLFKSSDGAASWRATGYEGRHLGSVVVDPHDSETLYVGTWDAGLFKSTDGGASWDALGVGNYGLAIDPVNPSTLYAGDWDEGVLKSSDGGRSWRAMNDGLTTGRVSTLIVDPQNPGVAFAGIDDRPGGVFKRTGGAWQRTGEGIGRVNVYASAIDPRDPDNVYMGTGRGVFKSTDGGASWHELLASPGTESRAPDQSTAHRCGAIPRRDCPPTVSALAVDPHDPRIVYAIASEHGLFKSPDGGNHWQLLGRIFGATSDTAALALDPRNPETVWAAAVGLFKSVDGGLTWRSAGFEGSTVHAVVLDPNVPTHVYVGTEEGAFKSTNAGATWRALQGPVDGVDVLALAIDPEHPENVFASTESGVFVSADGGDHWRSLGRGLPLRSYDALAIDPAAGMVYVGAFGGGIFEFSLGE